MSRTAQNISAKVVHHSNFVYSATSQDDDVELRVHRSASHTHCSAKVATSSGQRFVDTTESPFGDGPKRSSSGIFSLFKWFKKVPADNKRKSNANNNVDSSDSDSDKDELREVRLGVDSPTYPLSRNQSTGSVDTLFSTATVASFTYVPPSTYRPYGGANAPEKFIAPSPDTDTHKRRMKQLEKHRERDKNLTLRKKYKLFSTETVNKSLDSAVPKNKNNKNTCDNLNVDSHVYSELSLPLMKSKTKIMENGNTNGEIVEKNKKHRRTVSDSSKDKKAGAYCHVKGKRKAPQPPSEQNSNDTPKGTLKSPNSTLGRRQKRQAPRPPETRDEQNNFQNIRSTDSKITTELCNRNSNISVSTKHSSIFATSIGYSDDSPANPSSNLTEEQKSLLITNISKLQLSSNRQSVMESSSDYQSVVNDTVPDVVCNDSLKLVHGYLKPVKESAKSTKTDADDTAQQKPVAPVSPISPRPWYKRTLSGNRDSIGSSSHLKRELLFKHSKSEESEDFLPLRFSGLRDSKLSSVFSRLSSSSSSSDDKKRDSEYRKSGISILTNISELDREAALIVQKEQFREQAKRKAENEAYYSPSNSQTDVPTFLNYEEQESEESSKNLFKKGSARELISKFNALTSATKITVNSALFAARESECAVNKNTKRFSCAAPDRESDRRPSELITPPMKRSIFNMKGIGDEFSSSKSAEIEMTFEPKISNLSMDINKYFEAPKPNAPPLTPLEETSKTVVSPPSASADVKLVEPIFIGWECTRCTLKNARTEIKCTACGMWKPFSKINIEKYLAPAPAQTETGIVKSTADINNCIKKSAPDASPKTVHNKTDSVDKNIKSDQSPDKKIYITETVLTETVFGNEQNIENETKKARTFAENVFKQLEMGEKYEEPTETAISTSVVVLQAEPTLEELRKARVARFSQDIESQMNKNNGPYVNSTSIDQPNSIEETRTSKVDTNNKADYKNEIVPSKIMTEEQQKLRKMLKEMKDSLPKKRKSVPDLSKKIDTEEVIKEDIELYIDESDRNEEKVSINKGAIPKTVKDETKPIIVQEILKDKKEKVVEAYVITKETRYENIKVRRDNAEAKKPIKVSAGSQTQSKMMPKVIDAKPPAGRGAFLPLTVEELSSPSSGTASISRKSSFGKGTFELIRAKDFAGITTNISSSSATPESSQSHTYANIPTVIEQTVSSAPNVDVSSPTGSSGAPEMPSSSSMQSISSSVFSEEEILSAKLSDPEGLKDFKATLKTDKHNANTLAINRLLRRLEAAIAGGQHIQAAKLAKDLARMKVNCSVTRQKSLTSTSLDVISVDMYVEDRVSHQGPIPLQITPKMTVSELKQKVAQEFEIPSHVQRWILDKQLATDDEGTVEEYNVNFNGCPIFLYLVAPDGEFDETLKKASVKLKQKTLENANNEPVAGTSKQYNDDVLNLSINESDSDITEEDEEEAPKLYPDLNTVNTEPELDLTNAWRCPVCTLVNSIERPGCEACSTERPRSAEPNYQKLMDLDNTDLVPNREPFECLICLTMCKIGEGVILRECLHVFCRECLAHTIEYNEEAEVKCPYRDNKYSCDISLQEREVKALVPQQVFEQHLAKSVAQAENKIDNAFHCKTPDCPGWCIFEDNVNEFRCPVCKVMNCLTCQVIHEGLNCKQYQEQMNQESETNIEARRTRDMLEEMVNRGEAMVCPTCEVVLMKKWGCDWLRCSMCKTEICWVTRGPRWGPAGKGDVSGGCKCGVNGIKCHPKCTYCH